MIKTVQPAVTRALSLAAAELCLVRPMQRMAFIACAAAMLGCQSQPYAVSNAIRFAFPSVYQIVIDRPDEAEANSGPDVQGALGTTFRVRKQNGRWILLEESINTGQTFFTV